VDDLLTSYNAGHSLLLVGYSIVVVAVHSVRYMGGSRTDTQNDSRCNQVDADTLLEFKGSVSLLLSSQNIDGMYKA